MSYFYALRRKFFHRLTFYPSGRLRSEGTFDDSGNLHGNNCASYYDQAGSPVSMKGLFVKGLVSKGIMVSADGRTTKEGTFDDNGVMHGNNIVFKMPNFSYEGAWCMAR